MESSLDLQCRRPGIDSKLVASGEPTVVINFPPQSTSMRCLWMSIILLQTIPPLSKKAQEQTQHLYTMNCKKQATLSILDGHLVLLFGCPNRIIRHSRRSIAIRSLPHHHCPAWNSQPTSPQRNRYHIRHLQLSSKTPGIGTITGRKAGLWI